MLFWIVLVLLALVQVGVGLTTFLFWWIVAVVLMIAGCLGHRH
ncbi:hypothetical protein [Streptodolium elevatio]